MLSYNVLHRFRQGNDINNPTEITFLNSSDTHVSVYKLISATDAGKRWAATSKSQGVSEPVPRPKTEKHSSTNSKCHVIWGGCGRHWSFVRCETQTKDDRWSTTSQIRHNIGARKLVRLGFAPDNTLKDWREVDYLLGDPAWIPAVNCLLLGVSSARRTW